MVTHEKCYSVLCKRWQWKQTILQFWRWYFQLKNNWSLWKLEWLLCLWGGEGVLWKWHKCYSKVRDTRWRKTKRNSCFHVPFVCVSKNNREVFAKKFFDVSKAIQHDLDKPPKPSNFNDDGAKTVKENGQRLSLNSLPSCLVLWAPSPATHKKPRKRRPHLNITHGQWYPRIPCSICKLNRKTKMAEFGNSSGESDDTLLKT